MHFDGIFIVICKKKTAQLRLKLWQAVLFLLKLNRICNVRNNIKIESCEKKNWKKISGKKVFPVFPVFPPTTGENKKSVSDGQKKLFP